MSTRLQSSWGTALRYPKCDQGRQGDTHGSGGGGGGGPAVKSGEP